MLSGWSLANVAFGHEEEWPVLKCRDCLVKHLSRTHKQPLLAVQRLEAGLTRRCAGYVVVPRYEVDELAVHYGYELHERGEMDHDDPPFEDGEQTESCQLCGMVHCEDCGTRLDTTAEQEQAEQERVEAAGGVFW